MKMIKQNFNFIPVFQPYLDFKDSFKIAKTIYQKNISGTSPVVANFEQQLSKMFNRKYAVSVSNGSVALDLALNVFDFNEEDEVIVPSFTIVSVLSSVLRAGAKPVFCDVDPYSWNMTAKNIEEKISKKTKAVVMVHTYGLPSEAQKIEDLCLKNDLFLIEDSAEAHGQVSDNRKCGTFGNVSVLSFYANKHLTTGEGGCLLTDDINLSDKFKQMRNLDFNNSKRFKHDNQFWNYRLSSLQASLGISQIKKVNKIIQHKIKLGNQYHNLLESFEHKLQLPLKEFNNNINHYWVFGLVSKNQVPNKIIIENMKNEGIELRPFFYPLHKQPFLNNEYISLKLKNSEFLGDFGFYIPMGSHINLKKQKYIVNKLSKYI